MKILFLCARFYPEIGGVEKHVFEISKELIKQGHSVTVITEKIYPQKSQIAPNYQSKPKSDSSGASRKKLDKSRHFEREMFQNIEILRFSFGRNSWVKKFRIWSYILNIRDVIQSSDIVHCHDVFVWYIPFRFLLPFKKVFTTFHGYESYPLPKKNVFIHKLSEKLSFGNICIGEFIEKWYGTKPDIISYGGVDGSRIKNEKTNAESKDSALFIGRLDEQTGITMYIETVKKIKKEISNFKFVIYGDGKFYSVARKVGTVKGFVESPERFFYKYRYAFVSRYLSILEALVAKRLVFAVYDNPIKYDYLAHSPFARDIVICGSADELYKKILWYRTHPTEEEKMVRHGYQYAAKQTWKSVSKMYLDLWAKKR